MSSGTSAESFNNFTLCLKHLMHIFSFFASDKPLWWTKEATMITICESLIVEDARNNDRAYLGIHEFGIKCGSRKKRIWGVESNRFRASMQYFFPQKPLFCCHQMFLELFNYCQDLICMWQHQHKCCRHNNNLL